MKKRFSILLLLLTICFMTSHAQQMPITVTPIMTPPYTPSLSKMCESGSTSLMVNVFVNDVTASDLQLRLHLKLESTGITIESVSKAPVRPISVGGGEARVLMGSDLADVLSLNNLTFKGYDKAAYIKTGALPGGVWRLTAWLEHYHTGRILSNKGTAMAVIASYPPPVLTSPKNNEVTTGDMSKPIVFTWNASKFMGGTASLLYTLEMWEMHTDGVPAEAVVASQSPIYTSAPTAGLSHTLIPTSLAMEPGRKYCWRVTVSDPSGKAHIQNSGRSEVRVFQYLEKCPDICELNVTVRDVTATATWDVDTRHKGGWNVEMYDDAGTYHETLWTGNNNTGEQMFDYGTKWHVRVQGVCQGGQVSAWSEWKDFQIAERFTTPKRDDGTPYECGEFAEPRVITNMEEKELKKGDIIENERGTTKYEIYSATRNDDGSYRGLSYIILSIWNCKVLGEYDNLRVNTDGVNISNFSWRSVKRDLLMADPDAIRQWTDDLAKDIAGATYNNTIKETIKLDDLSFETIVRKDGKYYAIVKTDAGKIEEVDITYSVDGKKRVAIEDKDGKQLVVDKNGEMMGVEEYKYCGGSALQLKQYNAERDSLMSTKGNVIFDMVEGEEYGFDKWRGEDYDKDVYPTISRSNDYRPSYMGIEKGNEVKVKASYTKGLTFKNERGVPLIADKENNTLTFNAGTSDQQAIYAYDDTTVVGKLDVQAYSYKEVKVHLVRVNNTKTLDLGKIENEVNDIWQQAVVHYTFDELEPITIDYANKEHFVHGGKGTFQNYNTDQKTAIKALPETADDNDYYLFFVDCYERLDTAGMKSNEPVSGYMPVGRHYGFIYNEFNNTRTISHELGHGVNVLHHTFSDDSESFHTTAKTDNLMDYNSGSALNHKQWQWSHEKHRNVLGFLDGEEESEEIVLNSNITEGFKSIFDGYIKKLREFTLFDQIYKLIDDYKYDVEIIVGKMPSDSHFTEILRNKANLPYYEYELTGFTYKIKTYKWDDKLDLGFFTINIVPHIVDIPKVYLIGKYEKNIFVDNRKYTLKSDGLKVSTVFEEFFHAAHYIFDSRRSSVQTEIEVEIAQAFMTYMDETMNMDTYEISKKNEYRNIFERIKSGQVVHSDDFIGLIEYIAENKKGYDLMNKEGDKIRDFDYSLPFLTYLFKKYEKK
ncbi:MAG: hypothetical protein MJZ13_02980 [Bacteroidales bacterium]|nr:hypothetical protein [Bacteroidales bacterium]